MPAPNPPVFQKQSRRVKAVTKPFRYNPEKDPDPISLRVDRFRRLVDQKQLKSIFGCAYWTSSNAVAIKFTAQAFQKISAKRFRELLGEEVTTLAKFEDNKAYNVWLGQCNGYINGALSEKAIASTRFAIGIRGRVPKEIEDVPDYFKCPISHCLMRNPVIVHGSGHTYEQEAIEVWLQENSTGERLHFDANLPDNNPLSSRSEIPDPTAFQRDPTKLELKASNR